MANVLPVDLIKEFVAQTDDSKNEKVTSNLYGTAIVKPDGIFVKLDGSTDETPVSMATDAKTGDRVIVRIENHRAYIAENLTSPASGRSATDLLETRADEDGNIVVVGGQLRAAKEYVDDLVAYNISAQSIAADSAEIVNLKTNKIDADTVEANYAAIDFANVIALEASDVVIQNLLTAGKIVTDDITAATGTFTKYLTGVNISGELINAGTISTERLIIKSSDSDDGILFAINDIGEIDQTKLSAEELKRLTLDGRIITAGTIKADQIAAGEVFTQSIEMQNLKLTGGSIKIVSDIADEDVIQIAYEYKEGEAYITRITPGNIFVEDSSIDSTASAQAQLSPSLLTLSSQTEFNYMRMEAANGRIILDVMGDDGYMVIDGKEGQISAYANESDTTIWDLAKPQNNIKTASITKGTAVTIGSSSYLKYNPVTRMADLCVYLTYTPTANVTANTRVNVASISSEFAPQYHCAVECYRDTTGTVQWFGMLNSDGELYLRPDIALTKGTAYSVYVHVSYMY